MAVSPHNKNLYRPDGTLTIACCDNKTKTIYVNSFVTGNLLKRVLCHEITHAAMFSYGVELSLEQEELLADLLATYGNEIIEITNQIFARLQSKGLMYGA